MNITSGTYHTKRKYYSQINSCCAGNIDDRRNDKVMSCVGERITTWEIRADAFEF